MVEAFFFAIKALCYVHVVIVIQTSSKSVKHSKIIRRHKQKKSKELVHHFIKTKFKNPIGDAMSGEGKSGCIPQHASVIALGKRVHTDYWRDHV